MPPPAQPVDLTREFLLRGGVLAPGVRRDLTDLNRQFLDLGLAAEFAADPRFGWSDPVRIGLQRTDAATRDRMAVCPFALFEIRLPADHSLAGPMPSRVEDGRGPAGDADPRHVRCLAFVHFALFVAWRFTDSAPLATRIALGLSPQAELQLHEMCPSEVARLAGCPELIRPRWRADHRFWSMLSGAAQQDSTPSLQRAHCVGICLMDPGCDESGVAAPESTRKPPR